MNLAINHYQSAFDRHAQVFVGHDEHMLADVQRKGARNLRLVDPNVHPNVSQQDSHDDQDEPELGPNDISHEEHTRGIFDSMQQDHSHSRPNDHY